MSDFEDRIAGAVEGLFAGVFRAPVQPAELARACAREMDKRKKLGVGKVYAPTLYSVLLSPADGDALGGFAETLAGELETYLVGHASERGYDLATRPRVRFLVADDLKLGRFEIIGELLSAAEIAEELEEPRDDDDPVVEDDMIEAAFGESARPAPAASGAAEPPVGVESAQTALFATAPPAPAIATVTVTGIEHDVALRGERILVGRLKGCGICLSDVNASREHAAFVREGAGWVIEDLHSTNGTLLNGASVRRARLRDGDVVTIGVTELIFNEPRG